MMTATQLDDSQQPEDEQDLFNATQHYEADDAQEGDEEVPEEAAGSCEKKIKEAEVVKSEGNKSKKDEQLQFYDKHGNLIPATMDGIVSYFIKRNIKTMSDLFSFWYDELPEERLFNKLMVDAAKHPEVKDFEAWSRETEGLTSEEWGFLRDDTAIFTYYDDMACFTYYLIRTSQGLPVEDPNLENLEEVEGLGCTDADTEVQEREAGSVPVKKEETKEKAGIVKSKENNSKEKIKKEPEVEEQKEKKPTKETKPMVSKKPQEDKKEHSQGKDAVPIKAEKKATKAKIDEKKESQRDPQRQATVSVKSKGAEVHDEKSKKTSKDAEVLEESKKTSNPQLKKHLAGKATHNAKNEDGKDEAKEVEADKPRKDQTKKTDTQGQASMKEKPSDVTDVFDSDDEKAATNLDLGKGSLVPEEKHASVNQEEQTTAMMDRMKEIHKKQGISHDDLVTAQRKMKQHLKEQEEDEQEDEDKMMLDAEEESEERKKPSGRKGKGKGRGRGRGKSSVENGKEKEDDAEKSNEGAGGAEDPPPEDMPRKRAKTKASEMQRLREAEDAKKKDLKKNPKDGDKTEVEAAAKRKKNETNDAPEETDDMKKKPRRGPKISPMKTAFRASQRVIREGKEKQKDEEDPVRRELFPDEEKHVPEKEKHVPDPPPAKKRRLPQVTEP